MVPGPVVVHVLEEGRVEDLDLEMDTDESQPASEDQPQVQVQIQAVWGHTLSLSTRRNCFTGAYVLGGQEAVSLPAVLQLGGWAGLLTSVSDPWTERW